MKKFTVLTQSYHQEDFLVILLKSFEKFKPKDFDIEYVVVEGSDDVSYKEKVCNISPNIKWFNNVESDTNNPINGASTANGLNIEFGKQFIESEWTFVCHNDIAVTSKNFFNILIRDVVHKLKLVHLPNRLGYIYLDKRPHRRPFHLRVDLEETNKTGEIVKYKVPILDDYYYKLVWNKSAKMVGSKILPLSIFKSEIKKIK